MYQKPLQRQWYSLSSFYQKYTHAYGIPILSSHLTSDKALKRACYIVRFMLADREDLRRAQYYNKEYDQNKRRFYKILTEFHFHK